MDAANAVNADQHSAVSDLSERDREILGFERQWWKYAGAKEQAVREKFDMSATRYYQVLNALIDRPESLALTPDQNYLLVADTESGDVTIIQKRKPHRTLETSEYSLLTLIPVGVQPNAIVVKTFMARTPKR